MRNIGRRTLATIVEGAHKPGALRPHLGFETPRNHPLWAFFRRNQKDEPVLVDPGSVAWFHLHGRPWTSEELRRKSFRDLHTLWYVVLRERNLLATQMEEARRLHFFPDLYRPRQLEKDKMCRQTMARIKQILNERRHALTAALELQQQQKESSPAPTSA